MFRLIIKRLFSGVLVLITVIVLICTIIYLAPVDPARLTFGQRSDEAGIAQKKKELGLDQPLAVQLVLYLRDLSPLVIMNTESVDRLYADAKKMSIGNTAIALKKPWFRESYQSGRKVSALLSEAIPKSVLLATAAFVIAAILGILFGIIAAIWKDKWIDNFLIGFSVLGYSLPSYVSAIILALLFGYLWSSWTGLNIQGSIVELNDVGDEVVQWKNLVLPAIALGIRPVAVITQLARSSMLDVLSNDYIRTAKAKGLSFVKVIWSHVLKNAMNPVVTSLTGWFASLLAGAFFVESVFNFKGVGELTIIALINYDIPVVLGCVIFICSIFVLINILADLLYIYLDPRVSVS